MYVCFCFRLLVLWNSNCNMLVALLIHKLLLGSDFVCDTRIQHTHIAEPNTKAFRSHFWRHFDIRHLCFFFISSVGFNKFQRAFIVIQISSRSGSRCYCVLQHYSRTLQISINNEQSNKNHHFSQQLVFPTSDAFLIAQRLTTFPKGSVRFNLLFEKETLLLLFYCFFKRFQWCTDKSFFPPPPMAYQHYPILFFHFFRCQIVQY